MRELLAAEIRFFRPKMWFWFAHNRTGLKLLPHSRLPGPAPEQI